MKSLIKRVAYLIFGVSHASMHIAGGKKWNAFLLSNKDGNWNIPKRRGWVSTKYSYLQNSAQYAERDLNKTSNTLTETLTELFLMA